MGALCPLFRPPLLVGFVPNAPRPLSRAECRPKRMPDVAGRRITIFLESKLRRWERAASRLNRLDQSLVLPANAGGSLGCVMAKGLGDSSQTHAGRTEVQYLPILMPAIAREREPISERIYCALLIVLYWSNLAYGWRRCRRSIRFSAWEVQRAELPVMKERQIIPSAQRLRASKTCGCKKYDRPPRDGRSNIQKRADTSLPCSCFGCSA